MHNYRQEICAWANIFKADSQEKKDFVKEVEKFSEFIIFLLMECKCDLRSYRPEQRAGPSAFICVVRVDHVFAQPFRCTFIRTNRKKNREANPRSYMLIYGIGLH